MSLFRRWDCVVQISISIWEAKQILPESNITTHKTCVVLGKRSAKAIADVQRVKDGEKRVSVRHSGDEDPLRVPRQKAANPLQLGS
jgi:hypothetical protein